MNRVNSTICKPTRQNGSVLLVSLIILLVISLLAVGGMQGTIMQERMSSNLHDRELAFQAAEAALRDAEDRLINNPPDTIPNDDGLFDINHSDIPDWLSASADADPVDAIEYSGAIDGVARLPQYYIERIGVTPPGTETEAGTPLPPVSFYRVTARGFGGTEQSVVVIRSVYRNQ